MIAINPKWEFKLRTLQNGVICLTGFVLLAALVSPFPFRWLIDIGGIAVAYYFFFFVLDKRASLIPCPNCGKQVATNTPWVCGVCGKNNLRVEDFPFTNKCEYCTIEPKAYKCHHPECGKLIFFTEDNQEANFARCLTPEAPKPPPEDKRSARTEQKEEKVHDIELAELDSKLDAIRKRREQENAKPKSRDEAIQESLQNTIGKFISVESHAKKQKALADEEYKNDPDMRQKAHEVIDAWVRDHI